MNRVEAQWEIAKWAGVRETEFYSISIVPGDQEPKRVETSIWGFKEVTVGANFLAHYGYLQYVIIWD